jgi:putative hydrolase of the HAD superfamily
VWNEILPGVTDGLARLAATGVALAVVSNSDGTVEALLADLGLAQVGDGPGTPVTAIVDSGVVGVDKPDPAIFSFALDALGLPAAAVVHVGDTVYADVDGATAAGIRPIHVDPVGWCRSPAHDHVDGLGGVADLLAAT